MVQVVHQQLAEQIFATLIAGFVVSFTHSLASFLTSNVCRDRYSILFSLISAISQPSLAQSRIDSNKREQREDCNDAVVVLTAPRTGYVCTCTIITSNTHALAIWNQKLWSLLSSEKAIACLHEITRSKIWVLNYHQIQLKDISDHWSRIPASKWEAANHSGMKLGKEISCWSHSDSWNEEQWEEVTILFLSKWCQLTHILQSL